MRYEVYGVYNTTGTNYHAGTANSMAKAMEIVRTKVNRATCQLFGVLVKERKNSYPYSIVTGYTKDCLPIRDTMLVAPNAHGNPIQDESAGRTFWSTFAITPLRSR